MKRIANLIPLPVKLTHHFMEKAQLMLLDGRIAEGCSESCQVFKKEPLREKCPYSEIYSRNVRVEAECGKIRTRKTPNTDTLCTVNFTRIQLMVIIMVIIIIIMVIIFSRRLIGFSSYFEKDLSQLLLMVLNTSIDCLHNDQH